MLLLKEAQTAGKPVCVWCTRVQTCPCVGLPSRVYNDKERMETRFLISLRFPATLVDTRRQVCISSWRGLVGEFLSFRLCL